MMESIVIDTPVHRVMIVYKNGRTMTALFDNITVSYNKHTGHMTNINYCLSELGGDTGDILFIGVNEISHIVQLRAWVAGDVINVHDCQTVCG